MLAGIFFSFKAISQPLKGVVVDGSTGSPLFPVSVMDLSNGNNATTDEKGFFFIYASQGDAMSYSFIGYHTEKKILETTNGVIHVELLPLSIQLNNVNIDPGLSAFQRDSLALAQTYSKALNTSTTKPTFGATGDGVGVNGLIGSMVEKHSRYYKRKKRFQENFISDEQQKFIDTRYKPDLVNKMTGLTGDSVAVFMHEYPMEYNFARTATDLELKMWIRSNFKEYLHKKQEDSEK